MNKRIAAIIITLVMVALLIPQAVFASESSDLRVAGILVANEGSLTGMGISGSVTYSPANHTLTLNNAAITAPDNEGNIYSGICNGSAPLTIHLIGENSISKSAGGEWHNALYTTGPLTITAEPGASLTLTAKDGTNGNYGISAHKGLTIAGGDITSTGGDSTAEMGMINYGIFVENGELLISGGSVTAVANGTNSLDDSKSCGIFCDVGNNGNNQFDSAGNITISSAIVSATGGAAEISGGIESKYHININGDATVVAVGGNAKENDNDIVNIRVIPRSFGLGCGDMGSVMIQDSTVIATGGSFSFNNKTGNVTNQVGRSCGIYCGQASNGVITFKNCVVVARAGTVDGLYNIAGNKRCAVFNTNSQTSLSQIAIKLNGTKIAGAAGYGRDGMEIQQNAGIAVINDYALNFDSHPPALQTPERTTIGISANNESTAATGVVIVPDGWATSTPYGYYESMELSGGTAVVNLRANALTAAENIEIKTAGHTLAAVSLYESTEDTDTAGISSDGSLTLSGGGEVIAVGGMTRGASFGIKHAEVRGHTTVDAAALTAYGFNQAMSVAPLLNKNAKDIAFVAFPAGYEPHGIDYYPLIKIRPIYPIKVNGVQVTGLNQSNVLGDDTVRYNPQSRTLTLADATVNGISSQGLHLNLALTGTNTINKDGVTGHGIAVSDGNLSIQMNGAGSVATDASDGIGISVGGSLTVNGNGSLTVAASGSNGTGVQIQSGDDDKIIINGGTFTASGLGKAVNKAPDSPVIPGTTPLRQARTRMAATR